MDFMELIEDSHASAATIIPSQLPVANWYDIIGEETFVNAILDRIVYTSYSIELKGESLRKKKSNCQAASVAEPKPTIWSICPLLGVLCPLYPNPEAHRVFLCQLIDSLREHLRKNHEIVFYLNFL
jgi:hypothetical protein